MAPRIIVAWPKKFIDLRRRVVWMMIGEEGGRTLNCDYYNNCCRASPKWASID